MSELSISGKVVKVLPLQSGQGKNGTWEKQDFVIETDEKFPKQICFTCFGKVVPQCPQEGNIGDKINVWFSVESREYNGKYYTNLSAWKIQGENSVYGKPEQVEVKKEPDDFNPNPPKSENATVIEDDLPF